MPIHKIKRGSQTCYRWGNHGKTYCGAGAYEKAKNQMKAAFVNGYKGAGSLEQFKKDLSPEEQVEFDEILKKTEQEIWAKENPSLAIIEEIAKQLK